MKMNSPRKSAPPITPEVRPMTSHAFHSGVKVLVPGEPFSRKIKAERKQGNHQRHRHSDDHVHDQKSLETLHDCRLCFVHVLSKGCPYIVEYRVGNLRPIDS